MRKISISLLLTAVIFFQFVLLLKGCRPVVVNYQTNIQPIIQASCAPCHIAGKAIKAMIKIII